MKKKNGFTLVELLAVIVILAIIMIIAIPAVLNTMDVAKRKSFKEYADKIVNEATKKYLSDELLGSTGSACMLYDIESDLGLSSTGNYKGYILVKSGINNSNEYYLTLWDGDYLIYGQKYDTSFDENSVKKYIEDEDVKSKGALALIGGCDTFSQINPDTKTIESAKISDFSFGINVFGSYYLNESSKWEIGGVSTETGVLEDNNDVIRLKELLRVTKKEILIERNTQRTRGKYNINIYEYDKDKNYIGYQNKSYGTDPYIITLKDNTKYVRIQIKTQWLNGETTLGYIDWRALEILANFPEKMDNSKFENAINFTDYNFGGEVAANDLIEGRYGNLGYFHNTSQALYNRVFKIEPGKTYLGKANFKGTGYAFNVVEFDENYNMIEQHEHLIGYMSDYRFNGFKFSTYENSKYVVIYLNNLWYASDTRFNSTKDIVLASSLTFTTID